MRCASLGLALVALVACADPVHDDAVAALGPEVAGESPGPLHRAGQPCLTCHGDNGPANGRLVFGGTIYQAETGEPAPLVGARVTLTDGRGAAFSGVTNAVGNFYVPASQGTPEFPVMASLAYGPDGATVKQSMSTFIGRDGSCADCHGDPQGPTSPGHVYLVTDPRALPEVRR